MAEADELYTLRSLFWVGSYQAAIHEANTLHKLKPHLVEEKEEILFRCYTALGQYGIVLSEIRDSPSVGVGKRAIKLAAAYFDNPSNKEIILLQLNEWLSDYSASQVKTLQTVAASIFMNEGNLKDTFRVLKEPGNLEQHAMLIQIYLKMFRLDLAQKQLKIMKTLDEDSPLTMLATAWVHMNTEGKFQEAVYLYEELIDKYNGSTMLLTGLAVCKMHQGAFEEAEATLSEALSKSPNDPDVLANLIAVSSQLGRAPEVINRYVQQLRNKAPHHELITSLDNFNNSFDRSSGK